MAITVEDLYAGLLGRTPDAAGLAYWRNEFGNTVDPREAEIFTIAAQPELARQQQAAYEQELAAANVRRVTPSQEVLTAIGSAQAPVTPPPSTSVAAPTPAPVTVTDLYRHFLGRDPSAADLAYWNQTFGPTIDATELGQFQLAAQPELEARPLLQIQSLLDAPQTGSGKSSGPAYDLNQQVLQMDKFRLQLREAYNNPALINQIAQQVSDSNLTQEHKNLVNEFVNDARNRIASNPNALTGRYVSNAAKSLDDAFGGVLGFNQANILSLDYTPIEVLEAVDVYRDSAGRLLPEDALRVARDFDSTDSANLGKALRTSQNSQGQEGLLGSTFGITQAIARYNPATNSFTPDQGGAAKDVFAAQFNANLNIGSSRENTEGMTSVGEGFFTKKLGNPGAYDLFEVYYQDPNTGTVTQVGTSTNFNPELSGFKKFISSTLGKIIIGVGAGLLAPGLSGLLATGTWGGLAGAGATLGSSLAAGGLLGAASSGITGGNVLTGAITGSIGAGISFGIGQAGGLGNVIARGGFLTDPKIIATLNKYVSGFGGTAAGLSDEAAEALLQSQYDDLVSAIGRNAADEVFFGAATGTNLSETTKAVIAEAGDAARVEVTETAVNEAARSAANAANAAAAGAAAAAAAPSVEVAAPRPPAPSPIPAPVIPTNVAPPVDVTASAPAPSPVPAPIPPIDVAPTVEVRATTPPPPPPPPSPPIIIPENLAPPVEVTETRVPPPPPDETPNIAPIIDLSRPLVPTPDTTLGQDIRNIRDIAGNYLPYFFTAASLLPGITPQPSTPDPNLPAWVYNPAQSRALQFINQIPSMQYPYFAPNFSNLFQRGGLGAGQYLGYGLLPRAGDIPAQTLLGVPTLAVNNIGVPIGQGSVGQAALI